MSKMIPGEVKTISLRDSQLGKGKDGIAGEIIITWTLFGGLKVEIRRIDESYCGPVEVKMP